MRRVYRNMIPMMSTASHSLMAVDEFDDIVGVCGVFAPGECRQSREQRNRLMESAMVSGPDVLVRMSRWL